MPCFVAKIKSEDSAEVISALQIKTGIKKGEEAYMVTLVETELEICYCCRSVEGVHRCDVKPKKCEFGEAQIMLLGHIICKGQVRMDSKKIQAIVDWPAPRKVTELWFFLGLKNYYRRFIEGYSRKEAMLTDLLKDRPWNWLERCKDYFVRLK